METCSIDFYCLIGPAIGYRWKYLKKERSRDILIWTLAARVKIKFLESLFPQRSVNRINSSSTGQWIVGRGCFGIWYGRKGLFRIHIRQAPMRIGNSGFKDSNINMTLGHTMNLNDLLEVELYNDNLKMFSQAWEETSSALGNDLDVTCSRELVWTTSEKVYTHDACQQDIVAKQEPKNYQILRTMVNDILEQQQQNMFFSQKERSRDRASWEKAEIVDLACQKARARKAENVLSNMTRQRKTKAKEIDEEARLKVDNSAERQYARKTKKSPSGTEDRPTRFKYKRGNCNHDRECDYGHPLHCKYFENDWCQMWKDCPFIHSQKKNRSTITQWKIKGNESEKEKVTVAIVNIANHWPRTSSGKLLQFETSMNTHLKAEGNLVQMGRSKMPMRHSCAQKQTSIRQEKHQVLTSELEESKIQGQISISERNPDKQQKGNISKCTAVWPEVYRVEWGARRVYEVENTQTSQRLLQDKGHDSDVNKTKFFRCYVPAKVKNTGQPWRYVPKTWCHGRQWRFSAYDGILFSDSWWEEDCSTVKQNSGYSDRQWHCGLRHASKGPHEGVWRLPMDTFGERCSVSAVAGNRCEDFTINLFCLIRGRHEKLPAYQKVRKVIECNIENFVPLAAVTKQKASSTIHWNFWQLREILIEKREVVDTMLDLSQTCTEGTEERDLSQLRQLRVALSMKLWKNNLLMRNFPRLSPMRERSSCKWYREQERYHRFPTKMNHYVFTPCPEDSNCEVCEKTKTTRARFRIKPQKRVDGIAPSAKFGDLVTADHKIRNVEKELRCGHKDALIVQDDLMNWIQSYPMKTKETSETMSYLQRFLHPQQKREILYTDSSKEFIEACQDIQWNHDTSTPRRSETNGVAGRAGRRVKERTAVAQVQSGLPAWWWDCAMEDYWSLRNVHDKMADGKTAFEKRFGQTFDGLFFGNIGWVHFNDRARQGKSTWVWQGDAGRNVLGLCATCGERLIRSLDDSRLWKCARIRSLRNLR